MTKQRRWFTFLAILTLGCLLMASMQGPVRAAPVRQASVTVIISEVAWGGTASSTSDEWIELYNPEGEDVVLNGWQLVWDSGTSVVSLSGTLKAGEYYLLERSDDDTVWDISADLIYTVGLSNSGNVLHLRAPDGMGGFIEVDTANNDGGPWPAGSGASGYFSMERINLLPDGPGAWASNDGITRNGLDADRNPTINGTPRQANSARPPTPTSTFTLPPPPTATPTAPNRIVISELRFRGLLGADDDFVELYNPTGGAVNIGNWQVRRSGSTGASPSNLATIPANTILQPGQHYLLAGKDSSYAGIADQQFSASIADDGGVALLVGITIVDQVGLSSGTLYREGAPLMSWSANLDQSYERRPGNGTGCYDTNDNATDFELVTYPDYPDPQNSTEPPVMCAGVGLYTPTGTATPTPTRTPTRTITPMPGILVINEFLPHASTDWNADGRIDVDDEYIEIINMGTETVNIKNWRLDDGDGGSRAYSLPDLTLQPRQIARFYGSQTGILLNDGGDSVRLLRPGGQTADIYNYPVIAVLDRAWCRLPDGSGLWTFSCQPTPGRPNERAGDLGTPQPPSGDEPACPLSDSVPPAIYQAECGDTGLGAWWIDLLAGDGFWLVGRDKWDIFIH